MKSSLANAGSMDSNVPEEKLRRKIFLVFFSTGVVQEAVIKRPAIIMNKQLLAWLYVLVNNIHAK
jgi:hypothetical protein